MMSTEATGGPVESAIRQKILDSFSSSSSVHFDVVNESHKHNVPNGSESHFNVLVVSDAFEGNGQANSSLDNLSLIVHGT
jgi:stress-induced morphogen